MPASAPAVHGILTALVQQPCVPADVAKTITAAVSQGHTDAACAVFASLSGQGVSPQLTCLGNGFGIAWLNAVRCRTFAKTATCAGIHPRSGHDCKHDVPCWQTQWELNKGAHPATLLTSCNSAVVGKCMACHG